MKTLLQVLATASMLLSLCELYHERIEGSILFLIWSFYLKYSSDQNK